MTDEVLGADAVVIATMGRDDEAALEVALAGDAGYIGLVASAKRVASLGLDEESRARVRSPAGLDLGPSSQEEIAVAILAELVAWRHTRTKDVLEEYATDPICGMTVAVARAEHTLEHDGATYYFCSAHCRRKFEAAQVA
jgi:xanthine dehydrogenase accessory factor